MLYAADRLDEAAHLRFEKHLAGCAECQADLRLWQAVGEEIRASDSAARAPVSLAERALAQLRQPAPRLAFRQVTQLLRAQTFLVQREMWPATAAVMALGVVVALVSGHAEFIYFLAPLIAAASLSLLFGPEHDPAYELALSTPTSGWKLLLARLSIVSSYNLLLVLGALLFLAIAFPPDLLATLALNLLAPMAFLSALALLLSIWIGTSNAIAIAYLLWLFQSFISPSVSEWSASSTLASLLLAYRDFWHNPLLLLALSVPLFLVALWSANRPRLRLSV
jgi:hypothetical protein